MSLNLIRERPSHCGLRGYKTPTPLSVFIKMYRFFELNLKADIASFIRSTISFWKAYPYFCYKYEVLFHVPDPH